MAYDTVRCSVRDDFSTSVTCVESNDPSDEVAFDSHEPPPGDLSYYLVRGENFCGPGSPGSDSSDNPRTVIDCIPPFACDLSDVQVGRVDGSAPVAFRLDEASGLAHSRQELDVLWSHNDDQYDERIFALRRDGTILGTYDLQTDEDRLLTAKAEDPEDIAVGPGPVEGEHYVYFGDVGASASGRDWEAIWGCTELGGCENCEFGLNCYQRYPVVMRAVEPAVDPGQTPFVEENYPATKLEFSFPPVMEGEYQNVETLMLDPLTLDLYFVTKSTNPIRVFRAPYPYTDLELNLLEHVADLHQDDEVPLGFTEVTGGDISADGQLIAIRNEMTILIWKRPSGGDLWDAFSIARCNIEAANPNLKNEAVAFDMRNSGSFYTLSEKKGGVRHIPLYFFPRFSIARASTD